MSADPIIPRIKDLCDKFLQDFHEIRVEREIRLAKLAHSKGASKEEIARALQLNPSMISRYFKEVSHE